MNAARDSFRRSLGGRGGRQNAVTISDSDVITISNDDVILRSGRGGGQNRLKNP